MESQNRGVYTPNSVNKYGKVGSWLVGLAIAAIASSALALDQTKFDQGVALYQQRSFRDAARLGKAMEAAKVFEQVLPSAGNDPVQVALVQSWIARSYFAAADGIKNETDKKDVVEQIDRFERAYKAGETALEVLGFAKPLEAKKAGWEAAAAKMTDAKVRAIATDATYYLASGYGQWGRLKRDHETGFGLSMRWRVPQLLNAGRGIATIGGDTAYQQGSKRVIGRSLNTLRYSSARLFIPTEEFDPDSALDLLTTARNETLIAGTENNPVSKFGFNNTAVAQAYFEDSQNLKNANARKRSLADAKATIADFIARYSTSPVDFDANFAPENEDAFEFAKELQAAWAKL